MKKKSADGRLSSEDMRMSGASVNNDAVRTKGVNVTNVPLEMLGCNGATDNTASPSQPSLLTDYRHPTANSSVSSLSTVGGLTARKLRDKCRHRSGAVMIMSCSRLQLLIALLFFMGTIFTSVFVTYVVTKEKVERARGQHAENEPPMAERINAAAAQKGAIIAASSINYDNEFKRILSSKSLIKFKNDDDELLNEDQQSDSIGGGVNEPTADELRLADNLNPLWYNLTLQVYVPGFVDIAPEKNLTFVGTVMTKFRVKKSTKKIELNALKLNFPEDFSSIEMFQEDSSKVGKKNESVNLVRTGIKIVTISVNESLEKVFFELDTALVADAEYMIKIPYSGPIAKKLSGLYLTQYTSIDGRQRYAAVTQMEPTDARRMVPCWDEPAFKAVWRLTVTHPRGSKAVSNAIELSEDQPTKDPDWITTTFDDTLPMSSYLLALVVSDFQYVEGYTTKHTRFRIWARRDALNLTSYALHAGIKVLQFYEDYYGIPFPLPKQDMMAFPDFAAGAMENWGLVTYREKYLLYSPDYYTLLQKMAVASVVSHELAHQWFGNLVTMKWWSDLWLNEGFATLMEYLGTDAISDGSFRMEEYFLIESLDSAFDRDARATSHPLYFEIDRAEDVTEAFDSITYSKGASVLRMIDAVMGEKCFKKGLNIYLDRYKYSNAEHKNLWDALTEAVPKTLHDWSGSQFDVSNFAQSWTEQMGYPVVEVERVDCQRIMLTQHRFKLDETAQEKPKFQNAKFGYKWKIPIWYNVNGTEKNMTWLNEKTLLNVGEEDILVVNSGSYGYYRVQYSKRVLDRIANQLLTDHNKISVKSRSRIIDDTFTLAQAGRLPYKAALNLTRYLLKEKEFLPWEAALNGLSIIQNYFDDEPEADYLRAYVKQIIGDLFEKEISEVLDAEKFSDSSKFFENLLSIRIIQRMCSLRDPKCITKINAIYQDLFVKPCKLSDKKAQISSQCSQVPVPLRTLTYCEGVHYGTELDYEMMMSLYEHETVQVERERLMQALACSRDTHTLKKLLALASDINSTVIRLQDKPSVFMHVSSRTIGKKVVVDFFIDHWLQIYKDFKEQQTLLRSIISNSIVGTSQRLINEVEKFVNDNEKTTRNLDIFKQRLEVIRTSRKWMEQNFQPLSDWFRRQQKIAGRSALP